MGGPGGVVVDPIYHSGSLTISRTRRPPGLALRGDVDMSTCSVLEEALRCAAAEGGDVHVDAAGLDFIDAAGLRVLVETAARLGYGRLLVVHTLAPHLREVVRLVGWDQIPNLTMVEGDPPPAGRID